MFTNLTLQDAATNLTVGQQQQLQELMQEFSTVFQEKLGCTTLTEYRIHMGEAAHESLGFPSCFVRFCIGYWTLNQVAKFDAYPMPHVEMFEKIGPSTVISTPNLARGYWQIPMSSDLRERTTFTIPFGLFEFEVMAFGLHNAPATFQRTMNHVLQDCQDFSATYLDDVVIFSRSWEEHLVHLWEVISQLQQVGLTVKLKKCQFGREQVDYLRHVIGGGKIQKSKLSKSISHL